MDSSLRISVLLQAKKEIQTMECMNWMTVDLSTLLNPVLTNKVNQCGKTYIPNYMHNKSSSVLCRLKYLPSHLILPQFIKLIIKK